MTISIETLEDLLTAPTEFQKQFIADQRKLERLKQERKQHEQEQLESLEQRWLLVPVWRRAIILAAQWVQDKFTPKYI